MKPLATLSAALVLAGAGVAMAGPASAEPLSGNYSHIFTDNGGLDVKTGEPIPWVLSPCGSDCTHIHQAVDPQWDADVHLQGNTWSGTLIEGKRTISFDKDSLAGTEMLDYTQARGPFRGRVYTLQMQLIKN